MSGAAVVAVAPAQEEQGGIGIMETVRRWDEVWAPSSFTDEMPLVLHGGAPDQPPLLCEIVEIWTYQGKEHLVLRVVESNLLTISSTWKDRGFTSLGRDLIASVRETNAQLRATCNRRRP